MKPFPVLMYHAVSPVTGPLRKLGVPAGLLTDQLGLLQAEGYELMGLTEALTVTVRQPSRRVVALTFDDGYRDFLDAAIPVLRAVGARATLYVPTRPIGGPADWLGSEAASLPRLLSWSELRECVDAGCVEIGSHGHTHAPLDTLPTEAVHDEVGRSKMLLEDALRVPVTSFCYPHGYHSPPVREAVRGAGYDNACEVGRRLRPPRDRWGISRLAIASADAPASVLRDVRSGGPIVVPSAKRALRPAWRRVRLHSLRMRSAAA